MTLKAEVSKYQEDLVRSVQELVQIKSVHEQPLPGTPFGDGVDKALGYVLSLAESMGFSTKNLDGYCGYAEYGEGELYIGVLSHVDICPEGEMWGVPPYGGMILNNRTAFGCPLRAEGRQRLWKKAQQKNSSDCGDG